MRSASLLLLLFPCAILGQRHSVDDRPLKEKEKKTETSAPTDRPSRSNPTYAPVRRVPTYPIPNPTSAPVRAPNSALTRTPTTLPSVADRQDDGSSPNGVPVDPINESKSPSVAPALGNPTTQGSQEPGSTISESPNIDPSVGPNPSPTVAPAMLPSASPPSDGSSGGEETVCGGDVLQVLWQGLGPPFRSDPVFRNPFSYQCRALRRLHEQEGHEQFSFERRMKYWILYCIFIATNESSLDNIFVQRQMGQPSWTNTQGWLETTVDPCEGWFGIHCDTEGRVTEILLSRNELQGTFPHEVVHLASSGIRATGAGRLRRLEIHRNSDLTNDPTNPWISELGNELQVLRFGWTGFQGSLPRLPSNIQEFDASYSNFVGPLAAESLTDLTELRILVLDGIKYDDEIPKEVALLPSLEILYLREANVQGDLLYMQGMTSVVEHLVDLNPGLSGEIPSFLGALSTLRSFSATDCSLTGPIPTELGQLTGLTQLWLLGNNLSGPIPSELGNLEEIRILGLEDTNLGGSVPLEVCLNRFSGELTSMSTDCNGDVDCTGFFPNCCSCCGRQECGS